MRSNLAWPLSRRTGLDVDTAPIASANPHILWYEIEKFHMVCYDCTAKKIGVALAQLRHEREAGGKCGIM